MINITHLSNNTIYELQNLKRAKRKGKKQRGRNNIIYKDIISAFDIEASRLPDSEHSFMYIWQMCFLDIVTVYGRTWNEFKLFIENITQNYNYNERIIVFVHNLSYEFQFLRGIFKFKKEDVFCTESRKILYAITEHIEFRCSYLLTNMSLSDFLNKMKVDHPKQESIDYSVVRYPWEPLSDEVLYYSECDVVGLCEGIRELNRINNDNLYTMPFTSTGYVRRLAKEALKYVSYDFRKSLQPTLEVYTLAREAFRGGNAHANRLFAGEYLHNVKSIDRSSSYIAEMVNKLYPITPFKKANGNIDTYIKQGKACLFRIHMFNIKLRNDLWGCPYLAIHKCKNILNGVYDNGRILEADELETTITDIDFKILIKEYIFDYTITDLYISRYGKLPQPYINLLIKIYIEKTELKDVNGQEVYYFKQKNLLNSTYGMMAQDPAKDLIIFDNEEYKKENKDITNILDRSRNKAFLPYTWGVWVTCWSRYELEKGIEMAGDGFVYSDTDSVKYIGELKGLEEYNYNQIKISRENKAYAVDTFGNTHYMGVYESEQKADIFITYGAKKYAGVYNGKLKLTISGVNKILGSQEVENIYRLKPGFIFQKAGGTQSVFNDGKFEEVLFTKIIDGHMLKITSNVTIKDSTYKLGITDEYYDLLEEIKQSGLYNKVMEKLNETIP